MLSAAAQRRPLHAFEMMERLGIDPSGGVVPRLSLLYATALRRCKSCPSTRLCRDWLDCASVAESLAPPFCPIGDILSELQFDQPRMRAQLEASSRRQ
jgi:Family of unknown function (DUF6455)